jgi:RNA-directed DNA polymerase
MDGAQRSQNLAAAWKRVKANKGAPGIDGMTVEDFPAFARKEWPRIARAIAEGTYRPAPVRRSWIDKPDGTKRPLGAERSETGGLDTF